MAAPPAIPHTGYVPPPAQVDLVPTMGAVTLGVWIALVISGVNFLSTVRYFNAFPADPTWIKLVVAWLTILNVFYICAQCQMCWGVIIANWGNMVVLDNVDWGWMGAVFGLGAITLTVQCYFAYRVWVLSGFRKIGIVLAAVIVALACVSFGFCMSALYDVISKRHPSEFGDWTASNATWLSTAAGSDIVITASMIYFLQKARTGFAHTNRMVNTWIILALETNALTAVGAIVEAAFVIESEMDATSSLIYVGVAFVTSQVYPLSLLTALNSRTTLNADRASSRSANSKPSGNTWDTAGTRSVTNRSAPITTSMVPSTPHAASHGVEVHVLQQVQGPDDRDHPFSKMRGYPNEYESDQKGSPRSYGSAPYGGDLYVRDVEQGAPLPQRQGQGYQGYGHAYAS